MADSISCIKFKWVIPQSTSSGELAQRSTEEGQHRLQTEKYFKRLRHIQLDQPKNTAQRTPTVVYIYRDIKGST